MMSPTSTLEGSSTGSTRASPPLRSAGAMLPLTTMLPSRPARRGSVASARVLASSSAIAAAVAITSTRRPTLTTRLTLSRLATRAGACAVQLHDGGSLGPECLTGCMSQLTL